MVIHPFSHGHTQFKKNKHHRRILIHTFCAKIKDRHFLVGVAEIQNGVFTEMQGKNSV
jgi:hypothetical protein